MHKFTLETGSKKHQCPSCGAKRFVRYISTANRSYLNDSVGRCDRESSCGYQYAPKQFFLDNPHLDEKKGFNRIFRGVKRPAAVVQAAPPVYRSPDYISEEFLLDTLTDYERNNFIIFLLKLFPLDKDKVEKAVSDYTIGTFKDFCVFPSITRSGKVAQAKLMKFDAETGSRMKNDKFSISSLPFELKRLGKLKQDFETDKTIFFGEHLTRGNLKPIGIVEAQKTAVICSILMPEKIWIASGSKSFVKTEKLLKFAGREIVFYPDADGFDLWSEVALSACLEGLDVKVSAIVERTATGEEKAVGFDLADFLIDEQITKLEQQKACEDSYNLKVDEIMNDEKLKDDFETILDEQKYILIDRGMDGAEAENYVRNFDNLRQVAMSI